MFPSPVQTTTTAQHTDKGQTMPDLVYFDCQIGGTPKFSTAYHWLRGAYIPFDFSTFQYMQSFQ